MNFAEFKIRWHGRAGSGGVLASSSLGEALAVQGKHIQVFPEFGAEKRGAPVEVFNRISSFPITYHYRIRHPNLVVILDSNLIDTEKVTDGLPADGIILINTSLRQNFFADKKWKIYHVDGSKIALETLGKNIPNSAILGSLLKIVELADWNMMKSYFKNKFQESFSPDIAKQNYEALLRGYEEVYFVNP